VFRSSTAVRFERFDDGVQCVRAISQSGLHPANCRLIDATEAGTTGAGDGKHAVLVLGFESTDHDVGAAMERALDLCREHAGAWDTVRTAAVREAGHDAVSTWRETFLRAPYLRDTFVAMGVLSDTFETAITWERFPAFHERVMATVSDKVREVCGDGGRVSCRFTHVYPNGPAPYYTVIAPARRGDEVQQWAQIKAAASDAVLDGGGTITHHHAVGRDHRPWYDRQRPEPMATALRAAKAAVDPAGVLNPGVLIDPR
jgi:alkyldihydroxyacetonephosphate synthase